MGIFSRIGAAAATAREGWRIAGAGERPITLSESAVGDLQSEDIGYATLGGSRKDVGPWSQQQMQAAALRLYRTNHMAKRLIEIIIDFVLGDGLRVIARSEDEDERLAVQACLDDFWSDPINEMDRKNPQRLTELNLWGEVLMPVMVNDLTKRVRLGWIDPACISEVETDPVTHEPSRIKLTTEAAAEVGMEWLDVVRYSHAEGAIVGNCFYYQINAILSATRGLSEFFTSVDWFETLDETMKVQSDRAKVLLEYIWDVTIDDADQATIAAFVKQQRRPKPGSMRVHNQKVKWEAKAPNLAAYESSRQQKDLKTYILGGFGYPNHWFGSGDDANLATAEMMSEPTRKALKRKTKQFTYLMRDVCRFVLVQATQPGGMMANVPGFDPMSDCFEIHVPDIGGPDVAKVGSALQQVTAAIGLALSSNLVTEETAREMFAAVASLTGVDIDPVAEGEALELVQQERDSEQQKQELEQAEQTQAALRSLTPGADDPEDAAAAEPGRG